MNAHEHSCGHPQHYSGDGTLMDRYTCGRLLREKLVNLQDSRLARCWFCGEWRYDRDDCAACAAPADRADLRRIS